jgi:2-hydroxychromene-2-carboxylate isomerase
VSQTIEYFFDYVSPFSYLADSQMAGLVERTGAELVYRPFFQSGVMQAAGNSPPATVPAKGKYMFTDIARWCDRYGVELKFNPHFPVMTVKPMRAALVAQEQGVFPAFHEALFRAVWREEKDVSDEAVLGEVIAAAGLDAEKILGRIGDTDVKEKLKANTAEAVERGAFGAPTFFVGEEMFFGNDRLDFLEALVSG